MKYATSRYKKLAFALTVTGLVIATSGAALGTTVKPSIRNFLPRSGAVGTLLTITGKNFSNVTGVKIGGKKATYTVHTAMRINATVPNTGVTGKVSVTTKSGSATSTGSFTVVVYAPDGSGTLTTSVTNIAPGSSGNTIPFTYTATSAGMSNGALTIVVPSGWSAPVTTAAAGCTSASVGKVATSGQTITVSGLTLVAGATTVVTYGATSGGACATGDGASAATSGGAASFQAQQRSTGTGTLTNLAASPSIASFAADGTGTLTTAFTSVKHGETGDVFAFTFTAAAGGMSNGTVTITVPSGWSAPTTTNAAGCTSATAGTVTTSGQTITVSGLTLAAGATSLITYGATSGGSCSLTSGATIGSSTGTQTFTTQEASTASGTLTNIASSPTATVT